MADGCGMMEELWGIYMVVYIYMVIGIYMVEEIFGHDGGYVGYMLTVRYFEVHILGYMTTTVTVPIECVTGTVTVVKIEASHVQQSASQVP